MMRNRLQRFYKVSVWGGSNRGDGPLYLVGIPAMYLMFMGLGVIAMVFGAPGLSVAFGPVFVQVYGAWQILLALVGLVGYILPMRPIIESCGLSLLLGQYTIYVTCLLLLTSDGDASRAYVFGVSVIALSVLFLRMSLLASERQRSSRAVL